MGQNVNSTFSSISIIFSERNYAQLHIILPETISWCPFQPAFRSTIRSCHQTISTNGALIQGQTPAQASRIRLRGESCESVKRRILLVGHCSRAYSVLYGKIWWEGERRHLARGKSRFITFSSRLVSVEILCLFNSSEGENIQVREVGAKLNFLGIPPKIRRPRVEVIATSRRMLEFGEPVTNEQQQEKQKDACTNCCSEGEIIYHGQRIFLCFSGCSAYVAVRKRLGTTQHIGLLASDGQVSIRNHLRNFFTMDYWTFEINTNVTQNKCNNFRVNNKLKYKTNEYL